MAYKGRFSPLNPSKYKGNPSNIIYRSGLELTLMSYFDKHPHVLSWSSEEVIIPYRSPLDSRIHRYFPDFWIKRKDIHNSIDQIIVEVKPLSQTRPPDRKSKATPRYINEVKNWGINNAKWEAAKTYCDDKGWKFQILTEKEINGYKY